MSLFKYFSKDIVKKILIKDDINLRISQPKLMNDPLEFNPRFENHKNKTLNLKIEQTLEKRKKYVKMEGNKY